MINFTAGPANIRAAVKAAEVATIVTSRAFVEKARLEPLLKALDGDAAFLFLEDERAEIGTLDKLAALFAWSRPIHARAADDRVAVLFTSGSEGTPKGVVLSSRNMLANTAQAAA